MYVFTVTSAALTVTGGSAEEAEARAAAGESAAESGGGGGGGDGDLLLQALSGGSSVVQPTKRGFRVVLGSVGGAGNAAAEHDGFSLSRGGAGSGGDEADELLKAAAARGWGVAWAADSGSNTGITPVGRSAWRGDTRDSTGRTVLLDVDTSRCRYGGAGAPAPPLKAPRYFASLYGGGGGGAWGGGGGNGGGHWRAAGATVVHAPTPTGFRVFMTLLKPAAVAG